GGRQRDGDRRGRHAARARGRAARRLARPLTPSGGVSTLPSNTCSSSERGLANALSRNGGRMLTERQQQIWDYLVEYVDGHGYPPTVREIGERVGLASPSTVHAHLANLERAGLLRRDPTKPRALGLVGRERGEPQAATAAAGRAGDGAGLPRRVAVPAG